MGEAIIGRYGGGDCDISNETKQSLGLGNDASLDDILQLLSLKDSNYATVVCYLKDTDGLPIPDAKIRISDKGSVDYTTGTDGKIIYKTNSSQIIIGDPNNPSHYGIVAANSITIDTVVGTVYNVELVKRKQTDPIKFSSNANIKFGRTVKSVDVEIRGGAGQAGYSHIVLTGDTSVWIASSSSWGNIAQPYNSEGILKMRANVTRVGGSSYFGELKKVSNVEINTDKWYPITVGDGGAHDTISGSGGTTWAWSHYISINSYPSVGYGRTGGASYFDTIVANGGSGGQNATTNVSDGNSSIKGSQYVYYNKYGFISGEYGWASGSFSYEIPGGNKGYVMLSNFIYY